MKRLINVLYDIIVFISVICLTIIYVFIKIYMLFVFPLVPLLEIFINIATGSRTFVLSKETLKNIFDYQDYKGFIK